MVAATSVPEAQRVSSWNLVMLIMATFGIATASIVPMSFSLAMRLEQIAPGRTSNLGIILGVGAVATLVVAPLTGQLSDRTRSRWGRRRPYTAIGAIAGIGAAPLLITATTLPSLAVGWAVYTAAWNTVGSSLANWQADYLHPRQRGVVSGLTGLVMQVAPVGGILLVGIAPENTLFVFLVPCALGLLFLLPFVLIVRECDTRDATLQDALTIGRVIRSYGFRPRKFPNFTWNWIGRFIFFMGVMLTASFTVLLFAQRLKLSVPEVAGVLALSSGLSIGTASLGSLLGGWLSDRVKRQLVALCGGSIFAIGSLVLAFAENVEALILGTLLASFGIALFSAPSQALVLDVLPNRDTEAGRYMAVTSFSQKIPSAIAPLLAPLVLDIGASETSSNFTLLYALAAFGSVIGSLLIFFAVKEDK